MPDCKSNCFDALFYIGLKEVGSDVNKYSRYQIIKVGVDKVRKALRSKKYSNSMIWAVARAYKHFWCENLYTFHIPDLTYDKIVDKIYSLLDKAKVTELYNNVQVLDFCDQSQIGKKFLTVAPVPSGVIVSATTNYEDINKRLDALRVKIK